MKKYILTVTLNPALDKILIGSKEYLSAGGKGINISRALKCLGVNSVATGFLGGNSGQKIRQLLRKEKIKHDFVSIDGETRANKTFIGPIARKIRHAVEKGPSVKPSDIKKLKIKYSRLLSGARAVVLSGRNVEGAPDFLLAQLAKLAHQKGVGVVLDTSGPALAAGLKAKPFMIKPNLHEAQGILGSKLNSLAQIKKAIARFHSFGVEIVILTMGKEGAIGSKGTEIFWVKPPAVDVTNDVGCGDALLAGFLSARFEKKSFSESLCFAVAAGTANAMNLIPGLVSAKVIRQIQSLLNLKKIF